MKRQSSSSKKSDSSTSCLRELRGAYRVLARAADQHPWLLQGSVNEVKPKSSGANLTYTWTRKVKAKTVTVALSPEQAKAFRQAIAANRRIEKALARLRELSQNTLLAHIPGVPRRRPQTP
jgi:hypothetical protein